MTHKILILMVNVQVSPKINQWQYLAKNVKSCHMFFNLRFLSASFSSFSLSLAAVMALILVFGLSLLAAVPNAFRPALLEVLESLPGYGVSWVFNRALLGLIGAF